MAKVIPTKEFKTAVTSLNELLKNSEGETPIKVVTVKKEKIIEDFTNKIIDFMEKDKVKELPENVIDFYNKYIVVEEDTEVVEEDTEEPTPTKKKTKKKAGKPEKKKAGKPEKKKAGKPAKKAKGPRKIGLMEVCVKMFLDGTRDVDELDKKIQEQFPESSPRKSILHICNIMKHVVKYTE